MLGDFSMDVPQMLPEIWLARPTRTLIAKITSRMYTGFSRYGHKKKLIRHTQTYKLGNLNEMQFSLPFTIEQNHQLVPNPTASLVRERFYLKSIFNNQEEWYVITEVDRTMDGTQDLLVVTAKSCGYELADKAVHNWNVVSTNLSSALNGGSTVDSNGNIITFAGLLNGTLWSLSPNYDKTFDLLYRSFNFSSNTVLDCILNLATTFQAVVVWDTVNRQIDFQQLTNLTQDKGFKISYEQYMNSLNHQSKADDLVTRFIPYGKDGLTINSVNPTGLSFLDDLSYFMLPFERDANKNVIKSSNFISDSLCNALLDYQALVAANQTTYSNLLTQLTNYQTTLTQQQNDLVTLNTTLTQIQNQIDLLQSTGQSASTYLSQQTSQEALITSKQNDINTTNANITSVNSQIASLQQNLSASNNFTQAQLNEMQLFIKEREWTNSSISDAQALMDAAKIEFAKVNTPSLVVSVDIINFFQVVEESRNWDRFGLGDTIYVEYNTIGVNAKAILTEIQFDHSEGNLSITVSNSEDILRDEEKILKMLYQGVGASASINANSGTWDSVTGLAGTVNDLYLNGISAAKTEIQGGTSNTIVINNRGLTSTTSTDPNSLIRLNNGALGFSGDGGNTFAVAIDKTGVYANRLVGQVILGSNLVISNTATTVTIDGSGMNIKNSGFTITNTTGGNGISLTPSNGLIITRSDNKFRSVFDATNGIRLQTSADSGSTWSNVLSTDTNGNLTLNNITANSITANSASINNSTYNNGSIVGSSINVGNGVFTVDTSGNMKATSGTFSGNITGSYIYGSTITGGSITSNTDINVTQDITLGSNIYLTNATNSSRQSIVAPGGSSIDFSGGTMTISAATEINVTASSFSWYGAPLATQEWVTANFAPKTA